jgi:hypothetical protein
MPASFYGKFGKKNTRKPLLTIPNLPSSYDQLKDLLLEYAQIRYFEEYQVSEGKVTLEVHLPGREVSAGQVNPGKMPQQNKPLLTKKGTYQQKSLRFKRGEEFSCDLSYNHLTGKIKVKNAHFGSHTYRMMLDDYQAENGSLLKISPIVPRNALAIRGNPAAIMAQPADTTQPGYEEQGQAPYGAEANESLGPYCETLQMPYEEKDTRLFLENKFNREQR